MTEENFENSLLKEAKLVFKYLIKIGASKEDAEDIVQETLYKTIKNIDSIDSDKFTPWLFKVAINSYYSLSKKRTRQNNVSLETFENLNLNSESTEDFYIIREKNKDIYQVLDMLKPSYKNLLVLKYFMDFSYKDIASILDMDEYKVKIYLYRARNEFKKIWEGFINE